MKKIKILIVAIVCALCLCFSFAGCSEGTYVMGSFDCKISKYSAYEDKVQYSFDVNFNSDETYKADYIITVKSKDGKIIRKYGNTVSLGKPTDGQVTVSDTMRISRSTYGDGGYVVELTSLKVYPSNYEDKSIGYAIGFGVTGGLILCGITAYFIVDKLVLSKKKEND